MDNKIYFATFDNEVTKAYPNARFITGRSVDTMRRVATQIGLKQTFEGNRLSFYMIDKNEFAAVDADSEENLFAKIAGNFINVQMTIDSDELTKVYDTVNAKYPQRMDNKTFKEYTKEVITEITKIAVKVSNAPKKAEPTNTHGVKVGDIMREKVGYGYGKITNAIVTKVTDKSYTVRSWVPKYNIWYYARKMGLDTSTGMGSFKYQIAGNEEEFMMGEPKTYKFSNKSEKNAKPLTKEDWGYGVYQDEWDMFR